MKRYELTFVKQKDELIELMVMELFEDEMLEAIDEKLHDDYVLFYIEEVK